MFKYIRTVAITAVLGVVIFFPIFLNYFEKQNIQKVGNVFVGKVQNSKELEETIEKFALTIWCEARGEGVDAMVAVADVIMNRVRFKYFPSTVKEVVLQESQFSCWEENKLVYQTNNEIDKKYFAIAKEIAEHRLNGDYSKYPKKTKSLFFVHKSLHRKLPWTRKYKKELVMGDLVFYYTNKL